jgi:HlyD family secretion protein
MVSDNGNNGDLTIRDEDFRKVVFVVNEGNVVRTEVETGISDNTHIQILSGLKAGDMVVTGSYRTLSRELKDGDAVEVTKNMYADK